jgi:hypothetical protein
MLKIEIVQKESSEDIIKRQFVQFCGIPMEIYEKRLRNLL